MLLVVDGHIFRLRCAQASHPQIRQIMLPLLDAFHAAEPMRPGMQRAALRGSLATNVPTASGAGEMWGWIKYDASNRARR